MDVLDVWERSVKEWDVDAMIPIEHASIDIFACRYGRY